MWRHWRHSSNNALCHPDQEHQARGLCAACYQAWRRQRETPDQRRARQDRQNEYNRRKHGYRARVRR